MLEGSVRVAKVGHHLRLVNEADPVPVEEGFEEPEFVDPEQDLLGTLAGGTPPRDHLIRYCIIASVVVHVALFLLMSRSAELRTAKPFLKNGEKVTQVRLIEPPPEPKKPEPPPKQASAVSDRNHTAPKEKKPMIPVRPTPPLGHPVPPEKRIASLAPPKAPDELIKPRKPKEEKEKKEVHKKPPAGEKPLTTARPSTKPQREPRRKPVPRKPALDLRPTPAEIATGLGPPPKGASSFFPDGNADEIVVDINTREFEFASYLLILKRKIQGVWVYPAAAAKNGIGGALTLEFSIARSGQLVNVTLLDSSGHTVLDESALNAIKQAAPYVPFPERMKAKRLRIRANFIYVTNNMFRRSIM